MKGSAIVVGLKKEDSAYAKREYGVTDAELDAFVKRMDAETHRDRKAGKITRYTGDFKADIKK
ncbi:MAG TPA: hypothetical protein VNU49_09760 [Opitutaceae bacterium]|jgi:hypothetical protein|nr:hypothetical protein [Opitutaceae bacterium]